MLTNFLVLIRIVSRFFSDVIALAKFDEFMEFMRWLTNGRTYYILCIVGVGYLFS